MLRYFKLENVYCIVLPFWGVSLKIFSCLEVCLVLFVFGVHFSKPDLVGQSQKWRGVWTLCSGNFSMI